MLQHPECAETLRALDRYHTAMVEARTDVLSEMLDGHFALVHITGCFQPKDEWLGVIRSGDFDCHHIRLDDSATSIEQTTSGWVVKGRGIFNATIDGMKNPWRLQFTLVMKKQSGQWYFTNAEYTTF